MEQSHTLKPYLIQAVYNWCIDTRMTPYMEVIVSSSDKIPQELNHNQNSKIIFNLSKSCISKFSFQKEGVKFHTKIENSLQEIYISYHSVSRIFSKEAGNGLLFSAFNASNEENTKTVDKSEKIKRDRENKSKNIKSPQVHQFTDNRAEKNKLFLVVNNVHSGKS